MTETTIETRFARPSWQPRLAAVAAAGAANAVVALLAPLPGADLVLSHAVVAAIVIPVFWRSAKVT